MTWARIQFFAATVAMLPLVQTDARADYMDVIANLVGPGQQSQGVAFPAWGPPGAVEIQAYDGKGAPGGGLQAGQVRLTFWVNSLPIVPAPQVGLQFVAFNTDLSLSASQIHVPGGWQAAPKPSYSTTVPAPGYGFGYFSWDAATEWNIENRVSILITGLGANATPGHFLIGTSPAPVPPGSSFESAAFVVNAVGPAYSTETLVTNANGIRELVPATAPEPGTLALACLGVAGLLGRHALRRRRLGVREFSARRCDSRNTGRRLIKLVAMLRAAGRSAN